MKILLVLAALLTTVTLLTAADAPGVTYVGHDKVAAALSKGGPLVSAPDLTVSGSHRDKTGQVEVHDKETDVIPVIDGEATFVTGGTMVGGKTTNYVWEGAATDRFLRWGSPGDTPVVGDRNGSGTAKIAVFNSGNRGKRVVLALGPCGT